MMSMGVFLPTGLIYIFYISFSQILSNSLSSSIIECCDKVQDSSCLLTTWTKKMMMSTTTIIPISHSPPLQHINSSHDYTIHLVTYVTPNIESYFLYCYGIHSVYASSHGYHYYPITPSTFVGKDHLESNDQRWNKVIILYDILLQLSLTSSDHHPSNTNTTTAYEDIVVWLDADLIVNNISFAFEDILLEYPLADLIISREVNPKNGIANSGCIILRNTAWSRHFLHTWWNAYDRSGGMDQHIFDHLYHFHEELQVHQHIVLLPATRINSEFPGLITYRDIQPVLHLAGESGFIRKEIFRQAWSKLCSIFHRSTFDAHLFHPVNDSSNLLLIMRFDLDRIDYVHLHQSEWNEIQQKIKTLDLSTVSIEVAERELAEIRYDIREAQQSLSKFVCSYRSILCDPSTSRNGIESCLTDYACDNPISIKGLFRQAASDALEQTLKLYTRIVFQSLKHIPTSIPSSYNSESYQWSHQELMLLQHCLDATLEYLLVSTNPEVCKSALQNAEVLVNDYLIPFIHPAAIPGALYYRFKVYEFRASIHVQLDQFIEAEIAYRSAIKQWRTLHEEYNYFGSGNSYLNQCDEGVVVASRWIETVASLIRNNSQVDDLSINSVIEYGDYILSLLLVSHPTCSKKDFSSENLEEMTTLRDLLLIVQHSKHPQASTKRLQWVMQIDQKEFVYVNDAIINDSKQVTRQVMKKLRKKKSTRSTPET